jgi:hypothetical protein
MIKTPKFIALFLTICCMVILLLACSPKVQNQIGLMDLTSDQQDIVNLLPVVDQRFLFFDFSTDESFSSMEFWVEVYEYGVSVRRLYGLHFSKDEPRPFEGQLAIIENRENQDFGGQNFQWIFSVGEAGVGLWASDRTIQTQIDIADGNFMSRAFSPLGAPVIIQDGEIIVLYVAKFSSGGIGMIDHQRYLDQPELIAGYPYVHIIKARFSR